MKKKLKLLFLSPGNSIHSYKWIKRFSKTSIIDWTYCGEINYNIKGIKFSKLPDGLGLFISPFIFLIKVIIDKPDIVHIHSISKNLFIGFFAMLFFKKKVILNPWGSDFFYPNFIIKLLQKFINNNIIFTDSFIIKNKLKAKNKLFKINFGVDLNFFKKNKIKNKIKNKKKIIFCPRGYSKLYNQFLIIKFIESNVESLKNFLFVFCGSVNAQEYKFLKNYVAKNKLKKNVRLLTNLNKIQYRNYLLKSFLVISASKSDAGLSSAIAEAMSCKCLVLCTNNRDNPFWIKHQKSGFLFQNNNLKDFTKKFFEILKLSKNKINKIKDNSRMIQLKNNNLNDEMLKVEKIYKKIANKS